MDPLWIPVIFVAGYFVGVAAWELSGRLADAVHRRRARRTSEVTE